MNIKQLGIGLSQNNTTNKKKDLKHARIGFVANTTSMLLMREKKYPGILHHSTRIQAIYDRWLEMQKIKKTIKEVLIEKFPYLRKNRVINLTQPNIKLYVKDKDLTKLRKLENEISVYQIANESNSQRIKFLAVEEKACSDKELNKVYKTAYQKNFKRLMKSRGLKYSSLSVPELQFMEIRAEAKLLAGLDSFDHMTAGVGITKIKNDVLK